MNVSALVVFIGFLILGTILTITITNYWSGESLRSLDEKAQSVSRFISKKVKAADKSGNTGTEFVIEHTGDIKDVLQLYANDIDGEIYVTDDRGTVKVAVYPEEISPVDENVNLSRKSETSSGEQSRTESSAPQNPEEKQGLSVNDRIPGDIVIMVNADKHYFSKGNFGGNYRNDRYIAARAVSANQTGRTVGFVVLTSNTKNANTFTDMILKLFVLSAIASLSVSILAIGVFSYNLVRPLKQMAAAAKQFAKGDFTVRVNETSNDEVGELAVAFNNMADSLSSSEVTRKSFVANVSHELKTPMTTIAGFIDGILDGTIPPEKHNYYLKIVSEEVKRLSRLVRSMLDLSRIDNGELKLNYRSFDLLSVLVTTLITFEREIDKKSIEIKGLEKITPKNVYGDKDLIHQVVYNLIENAVKFTNDGGFIELRLEEDAVKTDFVIKNSGTGINRTEISLVFDKFYKTDKSRSKDKKGLGLGLYLCRSIIRLHGGEISADSVYGEFTEFHFYIPKKQPAPKKLEKKSGGQQ